MFVKPSQRRPRRATRFSGGWSPTMRRLRTQLAVITTASTALSWVDNLSEHYRGGFQRKLMYVPILANPVVVTAGVATAATGGRRGVRLFGPLSGAQTLVAAVGFIEHQRGILTRPGANQPRQLLFNAWAGPDGYGPVRRRPSTSSRRTRSPTVSPDDVMPPVPGSGERYARDVVPGATRASRHITVASKGTPA
jgi:hypothetical protein